MKALLASKEYRRILHLVSIFIFSIPITTHVLVIALESEFTIGEHSFTIQESISLILVIVFIVSANIYSIVTDKQHKISFLITGGFFLVITVIQASIIAFGENKMKVFDQDWPIEVAKCEIVITGFIGVLLLLTATMFKHDGNDLRDNVALQSPDSTLSIFEVIKKIKDFFNSMDGRLALLLGMLSSLLFSIPLCLILYFLAEFFVGDSDGKLLTDDRIKFLAWLGIVGMQGSIISMLLSLRRFHEKSDSKMDGFGLFINALVRPFIGMSFAHLTFFLIESGVLTGTDSKVITSSKLLYSFEYHVCLAFVAGFTERIAKVVQSDDFGFLREGNQSQQIASKNG